MQIAGYFFVQILFIAGIYASNSTWDLFRSRRKAECSNSEFECSSGQCINDFSVCDGKKDCDDGTDETIAQCINLRCSSFNFQCDYGACIDTNRQCNNVTDCFDGSDEDEEVCRNIKKPKPTRPTPPPSQSGGCILPPFPEGEYTVKFCPSQNENADECTKGPGSVVPNNTLLSFKCSKGYVLSHHQEHIICINKFWDPEPPQCLKQCKPLVSDSMDLECYDKEEKVDCSQPLNPGTKVLPRCKVGYHMSNTSSSFKCLPDGTWETPLFSCVPACGTPYKIEPLPLIVPGPKTEVGQYPWHAGLYLKMRGVWTQVCAGTIISPYLILTAAHCVYDESVDRVRNKSDMMVAVGKFRRSWDVTDKYEQRIQVKEVIPQIAYRGRKNNYVQDIAVLDLEKSIVLSTAVLPACVDWLSQQTFDVGTFGTIVGWGLDGKDKPSEELHTSQLPYYDNDKCRKEAPPNFLKLLSYDKFCAGYVNGTDVQHGSGGGGMTFVRNNQHFVHGIVSIKFIDSFATFTNVTAHTGWLNNVARALKRHHSS